MRGFDGRDGGSGRDGLPGLKGERGPPVSFSFATPENGRFTMNYFRALLAFREARVQFHSEKVKEVNEVKSA